MYVRESESGHTVRWNPDDEQAAEQAMIDVVDQFEEWRGSHYDLTDEMAVQVRERYDELVNSGGSS